jgi:hypothetical protein
MKARVGREGAEAAAERGVAHQDRGISRLKILIINTGKKVKV